jgi:hypothetical protein
MKIHNESFQREKDELNLLRKQLAPPLELRDTLIKEGTDSSFPMLFFDRQHTLGTFFVFCHHF